MRRGGKSREGRVLVEGSGMGFSRPFLISGRIEPSTNLRAEPCLPAGLSSGPSMACCLVRASPNLMKFRLGQIYGLRVGLSGLELLGQLYVEHIMGETNAQEVVVMWKNRTRQRSEIAPILKEIEEIASAFTSFKLAHVIREANFVRTILRLLLDSNIPLPHLSFPSNCNELT